MYCNILVPVATFDQPKAERSVAVAAALCKPGGKITLLHVLEKLPDSLTFDVPEAYLAGNKARAAEMFRTLSARAGNGCVTDMVMGHPGRTILTYASTCLHDCIILGSHRAAAERDFFGSTANHVVHQAPCVVHVIR